jgi:hypothetical protein
VIYTYVALAMPIGNSWALVGRFLAAFAAVSVLCFWTWRTLLRGRAGTEPVRLVLGFALLFRILLLPAGFAAPDVQTALARDLSGEQVGYGKFLLYDNDVWRYVWDGHVASTGRSPYSLAPDEVEADDGYTDELLVEDIWWDVYDNVSFRALVTVYPPFAQAWFRVANAIAPASVLVLKLGAIAADLAVCWLLLSILGRLGLPRAGLVLYAWNPLVLKEVAGSGHFEPLMILPLLAGVDWATRRRGALAAGAIATATLVKLAPLALVPVLVRRLRWQDALIGGTVLALGVGLYLDGISGWFETMAVYNRQWHFNSGAWALLREALAFVGVSDAGGLAATLGRLLAVVVMIGVWRRDDGSASAAFRGSFFILAFLVLLSPAVMPWYLMWALPFAVIAGFPSWAVLCFLSLLSYSFYAGEVEHGWWRVVEYGGFALAWAWQQRGSWAGAAPRVV